MKLELHIVQNLPPHNLNRDDTGAPKDTEFGGVRRARVSSQCWKRAIRTGEGFQRELEGRVAVRTKRAAEEVARILTEEHGRESAPADMIARAALGKLVSKTDDKGRTNVLFYVGRDELGALAAAINEAWETLAPLATTPTAVESPTEEKGKSVKRGGKKEKVADSKLEEAVGPILDAYYEQFEERLGAIDIALFGRMLAENTRLNVDAACQVAHAISTNRVSMEFDYFTAVDDLNPSEETGAGMIGSVGYNSSCFYRYAVIDAQQLENNLGAASRQEEARTMAREGMRAFLRGAITAIPTGKQNTFAAQTPPALVMTVVRPDGAQPMSLANAFEQPVRPNNEHSLVAASVRRLDHHWRAMQKMYGSGGAQPFVTVMEDVDTLDALGAHRCDGIDTLIDRTLAAVDAAWAAGGGE